MTSLSSYLLNCFLLISSLKDHKICEYHSALPVSMKYVQHLVYYLLLLQNIKKVH